MENKDYHEWLDSYLMGELDSQLEELLKRAFVEDSNLQAEFEFRKQLIVELEEVYKDRLRMRFQTLHQEIRFGKSSTNNQKRNKIFGKKVLLTLVSVAAVIGFLIYAGLHLFSGSQEVETGDLYMEYIRLPDFFQYQISRTGKVQENTDSILEILLQNTYKQLSEDEINAAISSMTKFKEVDTSNSYLDQSNYLLGLAHLQKKEFKTAIRFFEEIDSMSFEFGVNSSWYRAFSLLGGGEEISRVIEAFEMIPDGVITSSRKETRRKILDKLYELQKE